MHNSCPKCMYSNDHPFGMTFSGGQCAGCVTHNEKYYIDWSERHDALRKKVEKFKRHSKSYDCVVPIVGDAEDFYVISKVLALGMSPLVVCVNDYFKNDIGWQNLHQLITYFDVDSLIYNPNMSVYKELVRTSFRKYDHIYLPFLQLHTSFPVHIAHERKIPLVIWGQNQAVEQVGKFSHLDEVEMSAWYRKENDLFGKDTSALIGNGAQVSTRDLNYYSYPSIEKISKRGVTGIYLSNYFKWDPLKQNKSAFKCGFKSEVNNRSFDIYERAGSSVYYGIHDLLKLQRCGYSKINDHVARELRHKRLTLAEGARLVDHFGQNIVNVKPFFDWLDITKSGAEWLLKHKLSSVRHLTSVGHLENNDIELPEQLKDMLGEPTLSKHEFITYGKGLYIN